MPDYYFSFKLVKLACVFSCSEMQPGILTLWTLLQKIGYRDDIFKLVFCHV